MSLGTKSVKWANIIKIPFLRNILLVSTVIAIALTLCDLIFIYPSFAKMLTQSTKDEAVRVARHLMSITTADQINIGRDNLSLERMNGIRNLSKDFKLMKLKLFSGSGKILYSTDHREIGNINKRPYFHDILTKGEVYTNVVRKDSESLEGQKVTTDVVETYVPIMRNDVFNGAFEIYYDITTRKERLDNLRISSSLMLFGLAACLLGTVIIVLLRAGEDVAKREQAEAALVQAHGELEKKVEERTAELLRANENLRDEVEERKRVQDELWGSEKKLRILSSQLITAQEHERERIAHELHDGLGQTLSAIKYKVEGAMAQAGKELSRGSVDSLDSLVYLIQNGVEEVRRISMDLRPSTLDDLGIIATISWFCREFCSTYPKVTVEEKIAVREDEVSDPLKIVIYRVLQEALNNMAKHSKADRVLVSLRKREDGLELVIEDNGQGFDLKEELYEEGFTSGFGLASMKRRIESAGGAFSLSSTQGKGSVVRALWAREVPGPTG
jgi:signal transduction histidine kinase